MSRHGLMLDPSSRVSLALAVWVIGLPLLVPRGARAAQPAPTIRADPAAGLDFGLLAVGATSGVKSLTLTAGGGTLLMITSVSLTGADANQFSIVSDSGGVGFDAGGQRIFGIRFNPSSAGAKIAFLTVSSNAAGGPLNVLLTGTTPLEPGPAPDNLLVNGSFEEPNTTGSPYDWGYTYGVIPGASSYRGCCIPGWSITAGTVDLDPREWPPAVGRQSVDLVGSPGAATIEQSFPTQPGQDYIFSGFVSHDWGAPFGRANVFINGTLLTQLYHRLPTSRTNAWWQLFAHRFRATTAPTMLTIRDVTGVSQDSGTALDGLSVTPATEQAGLFSSPAKLLINPPGGTPPGDDQVLLHVGECARLTLVLATPANLVDVTYDQHTTFFTDPARNGFTPANHSNRFCATATDADSAFLIYGRYVDPTTGQVAQNSVTVVVRP
jgi:hypothetical protein